MATRNSQIERLIRVNNKAGRPFGSVSKKNKLLREMIKEFTDENFHVFIEKMNQIDKPEVYAKLFLDLLSFRLPKLKSVDFKGEVKSNTLEERLKALHEDSMSRFGELDEVEEAGED